MAIYEPEIWLSPSERELLHLLATLIAGTSTGGSTNLPIDSAVLTNREARRLLELLEEFASSRKFIEGSYFVEEITKGNAQSNKSLREIYLYWRSNHGRARALSTARWHDFLSRLGVVRFPDPRLVGSPTYWERRWGTPIFKKWSAYYFINQV